MGCDRHAQGNAPSSHARIGGRLQAGLQGPQESCRLLFLCCAHSGRNAQRLSDFLDIESPPAEFGACRIGRDKPTRCHPIETRFRKSQLPGRYSDVHETLFAHRCSPLFITPYNAASICSALCHKVGPVHRNCFSEIQSLKWPSEDCDQGFGNPYLSAEGFKSLWMFVGVVPCRWASTSSISLVFEVS